MILCDRKQHTNSYEKLRVEVILYGEYFLWGKNFRGTTIYCVTENFCGLNFCGSKFSNSFIDSHQVRSKLAIVYTRDSRNRDVCQVVDPLISSMQTSMLAEMGWLA